MGKTRERISSTSSRDLQFTKLLVMLVEFQVDNTSQTTGNGTFLTEQDSASWPISIGKPPHDREFYRHHMEALRYYYNTVSYGIFQPEYDIFPLQGYYTLPQEMIYYNPPGLSGSELVARFEQYFSDIFTTVDEDPDVDFSQYSDFLVIHAGADWQHDIRGDSPGDIPSFFINVGDGKEVYVDDGSVMIKHLCNIPETIVQDTTVTYTNGIKSVSGYGVINSVLVHEFGHTLGFCDLYNTANFRPMVGYWDIMDSGGSTLLSFGAEENGEEVIYAVEGGIPTLPNAWHKELVWGEQLRQMGVIKDISQLDLSQPVHVIAAGRQYEGNIGQNEAYIIRVPLSETEYLLIENRQTDHDNDGTTSLKANDSDNPRVILFPTGWDDSNNIADEYDYALPGWVGDDGEAYGGGLIIWHIDNDIIYNQGYTDSNGDFISNFQNNSINTRFSERGIRIIEADGLSDLGNVYSMYWQGTEYEPYFPYLPELDSNQSFIGWSLEPFNNELSQNSKPALLTNKGNPVFYRLYDFDSEHYQYPFHIPPERVSFRIAVSVFDKTEYVPFSEVSNPALISPVLHEGFSTSPIVSEFAVFSGDGVDFITQQHTVDYDKWENRLGSLDFGINGAEFIAKCDLNNNGVPEYAVADSNRLVIIENQQVRDVHLLSSQITGVPVSVGAEAVVTTSDSLHFFSGNNHFSYAFPDATVAADMESFLVSSQGKLYSYDPSGAEIAIAPVNLPFSSSEYRPVLYRDVQNSAYSADYIADNNGRIYRVRAGVVEKIFELSGFNVSGITQLAIGSINDDGRIYLCFAAKNRFFAISTEGSMAPGFPVTVENQYVKPLGEMKLMKLFGEKIILAESAEQGWLAVDGSGNYRQEYSLFHNRVSGSDGFFWNPYTEQLHYVYLAPVVSTGNNPSSHCKIAIATLSGVSQNPIIWNGLDSEYPGCFYGTITASSSAGTAFTAFAYPNPVKYGQARIRVSGATTGISVKIFDIAGHCVLNKNYQHENGTYQDQIIWDTAGVASGIYFARVKSGNKTKMIKIGVEN
ncbi:MAG: T9SS type A sorting domain-containing protein [Candidatus Cloacimonetes bacterium]|nr:T9SS type A sorting domain-containing protein [Candidatus Cloacimonadota bacterium]